MDGIAEKRPSQSVARLAEAVGQPFRHLVMGVGDGRVVEVTAEDDRHLLVGVDELHEGFHLFKIKSL